MAEPRKSSTYQKMVQSIAVMLPKKLRPLFLHPAGPTTVFFWAPCFKWGLVIAGIGDIHRPTETISISQTGSLTISSAIWSRYSLIITPKNYNLFCVNTFTSGTNGYNFVRGLCHYLKKSSEESKKA